jgi:hypothetical protein
MKKTIWILWPSFIVGGIAETIFFTFFDPMEMHLFGEPASVSRVAVYSVGFLLFWAFAAASSAFTCFLQRSADEINRCPLPPAGRPDGCPKKETPDAAR